jgi:hypothetical protein
MLAKRFVVEWRCWVLICLIIGVDGLLMIGFGFVMSYVSVQNVYFIMLHKNISSTLWKLAADEINGINCAAAEC